MFKAKLTIGDETVELEVPETISELTLEMLMDYQAAVVEYDNLIESNYYLFVLNVLSSIYNLDSLKLANNKFASKLEPILVSITKVIASYKYDGIENKVYEIGGEQYTLPYQIIGEDSLTTREAIEVNEAKRIFNGTDKNVTYTRLINTASILLRKDKNEFPLSQPEIDYFIEKRVKHFDECKIKAEPVLDAVFFLMSILSSLKQTQIINTSSIQ